MVSTTSRNPLQALFRSPVLWGGLIAVGFYSLIHLKIITNPIITRYLAGHPVEYITATLFFVGTAALVIKFFQIRWERAQLAKITLGEIPEGGQLIESCHDELHKVAEWPKAFKQSEIGRRIFKGLEFVRRKQTSEPLAEELRHQSDLSAERMELSYGLVKVIIWAIPILGFLGTVMGITLAIANLSSASDGNIAAKIPEVTSELSIAFDTTALALALSLVLMINQFMVSRTEQTLYHAIEEKTEDELLHRFQSENLDTDPMMASIRKMMDAVMATNEDLLERQVSLWQATVTAAQHHWHESAIHHESLIEETLLEAMQQSLGNHSTELATIEEKSLLQHQTYWHQLSQKLDYHTQQLSQVENSAVAENRQQWSRIQSSLESTLTSLINSQQENAKQTELLHKIVDATNDVTKLQDALNSNLASLAESENFKDTLLTLSAAIQLLTTRLGASDEALKKVKLSSSQEGNAA